MELVVALKQIILIRHGATDLGGMLCGHIDPPLSEVGRAQSAALVHRLRHEKIEHLYTSDLLRARQTAEAISHAYRIPAVCRNDLREISFGVWEGLRWTDVQPRGAQYPALGAPSGETWREFSARVLPALRQIASGFKASHQIAVVTHLGVIRTALTELANIEPHAELLRQICYCSAHRFDVDDRGWNLTECFH